MPHGRHQGAMAMALVMAMACTFSQPPPDPVDRGFTTDNRGRPSVWPATELPRELYVADHALNWAPAYEAAATYWNDVVGRPCFVWRGFGDKHSQFGPRRIWVELTDKPHPYTRRFQHSADGRLLHVEVFIPIRTLGPDFPMRARELIAIHELGHALGLADDTLETSIMHESIDTNDLDTVQTRVVTLKDRYLLHAAYQSGRHRPRDD